MKFKFLSFTPDVPTYEFKSENESWGDSEDDNDDDSKDDDDENYSFTLKDYDEEEHDEEYESDDDNEHVFEEEDVDLYKDMNVRSLGADKNKKGKEESSTQAPSLFTVPEMAISETSTVHATTVPPTISMITPPSQLTTPSPAPTTIPTTTSIPKAQEERKLYIDVVEKSVKDIIKDEVKSLLSQILPKEVSNFTTPVIKSTINESLENVVLAKSSSQPKSTYEVAESLIEFELKKILLDKIERSESYKTAPEHKELYEGLVKSYNLDKDLFSSYGYAYSLKRDHDDKDKDEDPSVGSDRGLKKRKTSKNAKSPKGSKSKSKKNTEMLQDQEGDSEDQPNIETTPMDDWFKKPNKSLTPDLPADYFFNNDLEYLKGGSSSRKYTTSTTKTKAAKYDNIEGIKDMVLKLWSPVKVAYDKFAMWGISYWGPKRQKFYGNAINKESKHDVFSRKRITAVTHVKVMKWYGYGYLEKIIV
uniref:Uncharacterized protein n=1 Tax=Tanacetum cinerariifolium TaxID=118510 RepID=A0A6L2MXT3_TANCI|nr:hypothetical protein [Tanacetum cinerariifolium]